jgi:hypothetical protein
VSVLACLHCSRPLDLAALLSAVTGFDRSTRTATSPCPGCGKALEFQARGGVLTLGYTYWAGSFHFEGVADVPARGLKLVEGEDGVRFEFGGARYRVPGSGSQA